MNNDIFLKQLDASKKVTEMLKNNIFANTDDLLKIVKDIQFFSGFIGELPKPLRKLDPLIQFYFFKEFRNMMEFVLNNNTLIASKLITDFLKNNKIIRNKNSIKITPLNCIGNYTLVTYLIEEIGETIMFPPLFIKVFKNDIPLPLPIAHGYFAEPAIALYINHNLDDNHFCKVYFADINLKYMVSDFIEKVIDIPEIDENENENINNTIYSIIENLTDEHVDYEMLIKSIGFKSIDLHEDNLIITKDANNKNLVKLIDFGGIF